MLAATCEGGLACVVAAEFRANDQVLADLIGKGMDRDADRSFVEVTGGADARSAVIAEPFGASVQREHIVDLVPGVTGDAVPPGGVAAEGRVLFSAADRIDRVAEGRIL